VASLGKAVVCARMFVSKAKLHGQIQCGGVLCPGLAGLARGEQGFAKTIEGLRFACPHTGLAPKDQCLADVADCLHVAVLPLIDAAEVG
jgi:hypothetical protein